MYVSRRRALGLLITSPAIAFAACRGSSGDERERARDDEPVRLPATGRREPVTTIELTQDVVGYEPIFQTLLSGTFVPKQATIDIDIQIFGYAAGNANVNAILLYGVVSPAGSTRALRTTGKYAPPVGGVATEKLGGSEAEERFRVSRRLRLDGLGADETYTWAVQFAVVGGTEIIAMPRRARGPVDLCVLPDDSKTYVACADSDRVVVVHNGGRPVRTHSERRSHSVAGTIDVGTRPGSLTPTPDGERVLVVNNGDRTVAVVDTERDEVITTSTSLPAPPHGIACPDRITAYIAGGDGAVYPITIGTGRFGTPIAVSSNLSGELLAAPDGSHLVAMDAGAARVYRIRIGDGAVVATSPPLAAPPQAGAIAPDGTVWIGGQGTPLQVVGLDGSTLEVQAELTGPGRTITGLAATDDGKLLWATTEDGFAAYWTIGSPDDPVGNLYDAADIGANGGIALTSDGYISLCRYDNNDVFHFPGAVLSVRPTGGDVGELAVGEFADVTFEGAEATETARTDSGKPVGLS